MYSGQGGMPLERNAMQTVLDGWIERCQRSNQSDKESAADCRLVFKRVGSTGPTCRGSSINRGRCVYLSARTVCKRGVGEAQKMAKTSHVYWKTVL